MASSTAVRPASEERVDRVGSSRRVTSTSGKATSYHQGVGFIEAGEAYLSVSGLIGDSFLRLPLHHPPDIALHCLPRLCFPFLQVKPPALVRGLFSFSSTGANPVPSLSFQSLPLLPRLLIQPSSLAISLSHELPLPMPSPSPPVQLLASLCLELSPRQLCLLGFAPSVQ